MKIEYRFVDGEVSIIEVDEQLGKYLSFLDQELFNNNQTETRRHISLDGLEYEGAFFVHGADVQRDVLRSEVAATVREAVSKLRPQQQQLIHALYLCSKPMSQAEYAEKMGVKESSIKQQAWRARNNLRNILMSFQKRCRP